MIKQQAKEFQIIIGAILIGLFIIVGSYIHSQNTGFNACYEESITGDIRQAGGTHTYEEQPSSVQSDLRMGAFERCGKS